MHDFTKHYAETREVFCRCILYKLKCQEIENVYLILLLKYFYTTRLIQNNNEIEVIFIMQFKNILKPFNKVII